VKQKMIVKMKVPVHHLPRKCNKRQKMMTQMKMKMMMIRRKTLMRKRSLLMYQRYRLRRKNKRNQL
jgi:hypothetical protein